MTEAVGMSNNLLRAVALLTKNESRGTITIADISMYDISEQYRVIPFKAGSDT